LEMSRLCGYGIICEDGVSFFGKGAFATFIDCEMEAREQGYDILVGGVSQCQVVSDAENRIARIKNMKGLHLYSVLNDKVDFSKCPKNEFLDRWVGENYKVAVCYPMVSLRRVDFVDREVHMV